jgi:hypothetical protein
MLNGQMGEWRLGKVTQGSDSVFKCWGEGRIWCCDHNSQLLTGYDVIGPAPYPTPNPERFEEILKDENPHFLSPSPDSWLGANDQGVFNNNHSWSACDEGAADSESAAIFENGKVIALVVRSSKSRLDNDGDELFGRSRLICAAPKMLAALKSLANKHGGTTSYCNGTPEALAIHSLIAEVEGIGNAP